MDTADFGSFYDQYVISNPKSIFWIFYDSIPCFNKLTTKLL